MPTTFPHLINARALLNPAQMVAVANALSPPVGCPLILQERRLYLADQEVEPVLLRVLNGCGGARWDNRRPRQEA